MKERYTYSDEEGLSGKLELTQKETRVIDEIGLDKESLQKLIKSQHFAEGSYALLFELLNDDSPLVAKVWKNRKRDSERGANESIALKLLKLKSFNIAPEIKGYLPTSTILFEEKKEGHPVKIFNKDIIDRLAQALAYLHSIKLEKYGSLLKSRKMGTRMNYFNDGIETLRRLALPFKDQKEIMGLIDQSLGKMENEAHLAGNAFKDNSFTLIHFDLNPNNIIYSEKDKILVIIDWEQASAGDNAMDIAKLFLKSNFNLSQRQEFLEQYENCLGKKDSHFQERLGVYEPFVLINSILWRLRVLRDAPQETSSSSEKEFYERVKNNLDRELISLRNFLKVKAEK